MELNRHHYFMIGLFLLFLGLELQTVESITLTPEVTKFLAERTGHPVAATSKAVGVLTGTEPPLPPKTISFPEWTGYAALSASAVLILYSLMLPKPG